MQLNKAITVFFILSILTACSTSRYSQRHDSAPMRKPTFTELQDASVKIEPVGRGNNPYQIKGIDYVPMKTRKPFQETGIASWYGKKFHGHLTSNGEIYDMYAMSAAHKTLPLPSYVQVTNLSNNKSVIVRVNDRGPFHQNRIIDLSYSAAYKIGVYDTGTAKVKIETLLSPPKAKVIAAKTPPKDEKNNKQPPKQAFLVIVEGFKTKSEAVDAGKGLSIMLNEKVSTVSNSSVNILQFGPYKKWSTALNSLNKLNEFGYRNVRISATK